MEGPKEKNKLTKKEKGIKKARREEDVSRKEDGVSKRRGGVGMKECANLSLRSLGLQRTMRTVKG